MDSIIKGEIFEKITKAQDDEEFAADISFINEQAAQRFASLANQVVFDTTIKLDYGAREDIAQKLRNYFVPRITEMNIDVVGNSISIKLPREAIESIAQHSKELGIKSIQSAENFN